MRKQVEYQRDVQRASRQIWYHQRTSKVVGSDGLEVYCGLHFYHCTT
jgi:hypothetical protein